MGTSWVSEKQLKTYVMALTNFNWSGDATAELLLGAPITLVSVLNLPWSVFATNTKDKSASFALATEVIETLFSLDWLARRSAYDSENRRSAKVTLRRMEPSDAEDRNPSGVHPRAVSDMLLGLSILVFLDEGTGDAS